MVETEAGVPADWIRQTVRARAQELGYSAYATAKLAGVSYRTIRLFFAGQSCLKSDTLGHVLHVLQLTLAPKS